VIEESPQNRPLRPFPQQLDLEGKPHDLAPEVERLRLFEPAPAQLPGQAWLELDDDELAAREATPF
jgi:hypothetical protein